MRRFLGGILKLSLAGLALLSVAAYLGGLHRLLELTTHFRLQYLVLAALLLLVFAARRQVRWGVLAVSVVAANAFSLLSSSVPGATAAADQDTVAIRLLLANLQFSNQTHEAFRSLVLEQKPDIAVVEEVTRAWAEALTTLRDRYPYARVIARPGAFGIGILSRRSMTRVEVLDLGHPVHPALLARIPVGARELSVLAAHPPPPTSEAGFSIRNDQLDQLGELAKGLDSPKVMLGDLNASPWSPYFSRLLRQSGLVNARDGFGILPTWPSFFMPAMIPIDHCLVSPDVRVTHMRTGPDIGSDHLPVVIDLRVQSGRLATQRLKNNDNNRETTTLTTTIDVSGKKNTPFSRSMRISPGNLPNHANSQGA
jgi:endonuclease/exonuclease/phosphatase (EEP) superfamily protein YafD